MRHDARDVANKLILRGVDDKNFLTPLQVVKLVYYCHAWMLAWENEPLIQQRVEAWKYGPVIADVYNSLKRYGKNPVHVPIDVPNERYNEIELDTMDTIYSHYGQYDGIQLSSMTHRPGSPWDQVWNASGFKFWRTFLPQPTIPDELIKVYYRDERYAV